MAPNRTITKPFPGPVIVTLEPPKRETTIPPTTAAIIPEIGGASLANANPRPKGSAIRDTTKPENKFLGSEPMNVVFFFFLAVKSIF